MIIYEVQITINKEVEEEWLHWMKTIHVPNVIASGLVNSFRILTPLDLPSQVYLFQYDFGSPSDYAQYQEEFSPRLREEVLEKYDGKFQAKRNVYKRV